MRIAEFGFWILLSVIGSYENMQVKTRKQRFKELQSFANKGLNACVIEFAEKYLSDFPKSGIAWFIYYEALNNLSKRKKAKLALQKAIEFVQNPEENLDWLYLQMGKLLEDSGKFGEAIDWYEKASLQNPSEATFHIYRGLVYFHQEKYEKADDILVEATKCSDGCIDEAFYKLGVVRMAKRDYQKAKICFEQSLEIDPKYKEAKQALKDVTQVLSMLEDK